MFNRNRHRKYLSRIKDPRKANKETVLMKNLRWEMLQHVSLFHSSVLLSYETGAGKMD